MDSNQFSRLVGYQHCHTHSSSFSSPNYLLSSFQVRYLHMLSSLPPSLLSLFPPLLLSPPDIGCSFPDSASGEISNVLFLVNQLATAEYRDGAQVALVNAPVLNLGTWKYVHNKSGRSGIKKPFSFFLYNFTEFLAHKLT